MEKFWTWFSRADNVIGIFTALLAAGSFILLWRQNRRLRELAINRRHVSRTLPNCASCTKG